MQIQTLQPLPATLENPEVGISHFAYSEDLIAGGCNLPQFDVFRKEFYPQVYLRAQDNTYTEIGRLETPLASCAFCSSGQSLYIIGGMTHRNEKTVFLSAVFSLKFDGKRLITEEMPKFPCSVHSAGACVFEGAIIIAGGVQNGQQSDKCYRLDIGGEKWQEIKSLPDGPRQQPVLVSHTFPTLFSGFQGGENAHVYTDVLVFKEGKWQQVDELPFAVAGGSAVVINGCIYLMGGVNELVFTTALRREHYTANSEPAVEKWLQTFGAHYIHHDRSYYRFNKFLAIYSPGAPLQIIKGPSEIARAGFGMIADGEDIIIVDGETEPRKRCRNTMKIVLNK